VIIGVGTDICENKRIRKLVKKYDERFLNKVFTQNEIDYCKRKKNPIPHLTARFALKEAFIKALGLSRDLTLSYKDVSLKGNLGKKEIVYQGKLAEVIKKKNVTSVTFSISHAKKYSNALVVLEK